MKKFLKRLSLTLVSLLFLLSLASVVVSHQNKFRSLIIHGQSTGALTLRAGSGIDLGGKITSNQIYTSATTPFYFRTSLSATSGTHNNARFRAQSTATSASTSDIRGVYAQAISNAGLFAGAVTSIYINSIAKGTSTTGTIRGALIDTETEGTPDSVGNLIGLHIRNKSTITINADNISLLIENEKMGSGEVADAGIVLKTTTWGSGVTAWTYGIDMNQTGAFGTADIRLQNGEAIDNGTNGIINFAGELSSVLTYSKDVGATTRDLLVDNAGLIGYQASSIKYKKNIVDLNADFVDKIYNLRPVSFDWKASGVKGYGMIAEETAQILPEVVSMDKDGLPETVNYHQMVPFLLKAIQDQQTRIIELERTTYKADF